MATQPARLSGFAAASNYTIDHNTFLHDCQNIKASEGQQFEAQNILIHHYYSDSHHRMFLEINTGNGSGNPTYNPGTANFQVYDNYLARPPVTLARRPEPLAFPRRLLRLNSPG
jgi:hypothetical protein